MTKLTYDPPFELSPPASQADSETLRQVIAFYRKKGMGAHADYLQAILDDREGLEERGGEGSGHFGHAGRPGEVGGSAAGEGGPTRHLGITSYRPGKSVEDVERELGIFKRALSEIPGVSDIKASLQWGVYEDQTEPTWAVEFKGNGEALSLVAQALKEADQDSGLIWNGDLEGASEAKIAEITMDLSSIRFTAGVRPELEGVLSSFGLGATWIREGTQLKMVSLGIPQFGSNPDTISDMVREAKITLDGMQLSYESSLRVGKVLVATREANYEWR